MQSRDGLFCLFFAPPGNVDGSIALIEDLAKRISNANVATSYYEDLKQVRNSVPSRVEEWATYLARLILEVFLRQSWVWNPNTLVDERSHRSVCVYGLDTEHSVAGLLPGGLKKKLVKGGYFGHLMLLIIPHGLPKKTANVDLHGHKGMYLRDRHFPVAIMQHLCFQHGNKEQ